MFFTTILCHVSALPGSADIHLGICFVAYKQQKVSICNKNWERLPVQMAKTQEQWYNVHSTIMICSSGKLDGNYWHTLGKIAPLLLKPHSCPLLFRPLKYKYQYLSYAAFKGRLTCAKLVRGKMAYRKVPAVPVIPLEFIIFQAG